jgi:NAD(P)-dependent dehydrogenase (short-subunit alcohol dehydrogenase family)
MAGIARTAIVTGGSRGIGFCVAQQLVRLGFHVVVTGRNEESLLRAKQYLLSLAAAGEVTTLAFDASDPEATRAHLSGVAADVLVANVGIGSSGSITSATHDQWEEILTTNVTSAFAAIQAVIGGMLERKWGRIVTVGSMASHVGIRYGVAYTASKHALLGLTRAAALDTAGTGVTVNMVAPTFVRTDMTAENAKRIAVSSGRSAEEAQRLLASLSPENRLLEPEEVASEIVRLVSDEAGGISGESVLMGFGAHGLEHGHA